MRYPPPAQFVSDTADLGIAFGPDDVEKLARFLELLMDANEQFNLTGIKDPNEAWHKHIFDALTLMPLLASIDAKRVIDVGSGGGIPGLPLAIVLPDIAFTLLEATGKKARFLETAASALELQNITIVNDRAEAIGRDVDHHRAKYDAVIARAVGRLPVLLELCVPLATEGGLIFAVKGEQAQQEVEEAKRALHLLHCAVADLHKTATGTVVLVEKLRATPKAYPRKPGEPKRSPLVEWEKSTSQPANKSTDAEPFGAVTPSSEC